MAYLMNIEEIMHYLPHRPPFLLIDRVIDLEPGKSLTALKNVTFNEYFFAGHFPGKPVMPGVLILEALAQAAAVLAYKTNQEKTDGKALYYFAGIDDARFKRIVIPGDQLKLKIDVSYIRKNLWKVKGMATVDNEIACSAELMSVRKEDRPHD